MCNCACSFLVLFFAPANFNSMNFGSRKVQLTVKALLAVNRLYLR